MYTHWGREYMTEPDNGEITLAHEFIDSGVDLVIGSHPHVVQTKEEYNGKIIYYSLGNFVFDQYFDPNTREGLAVEVTIDPNDKSIIAKDFPIMLGSSGQTFQD
jgi:poly-gamma-glutamate synthesis protein (capsule biosynthesis protein)